MCVWGGRGARRERDRKAPGVDQSSDRSVTARGDDIDSPTHVDVLNLGRDHFSALAALTHNVAYGSWSTRRTWAFCRISSPDIPKDAVCNTKSSPYDQSKIIILWTLKAAPKMCFHLHGHTESMGVCYIKNQKLYFASKPIQQLVLFVFIGRQTYIQCSNSIAAGDEQKLRFGSGADIHLCSSDPN